MRIIRCENGNISLVLKEVVNVADKEIKSNDVDAAFEKHVPQYDKFEDRVEVYVNHVMEEDHYIEWICLVTDNEEKYVYLNPGDKVEVTFDKVTNGKIYSYCNKHGLWVENIKE